MSEDIKPELIEKACAAYRRPNRMLTNDSATRHHDCMSSALEAVADDLRAEGAAQALREAADDLERRINEPGLILAADKYGGYHAGERARGQREADVLRSRAERIEPRSEDNE